MSLLGLALSDLLALLFIIPFVVFINPYSLYSEDVLWNASDLAYIFAGKFTFNERVGFEKGKKNQCALKI